MNKKLKKEVVSKFNIDGIDEEGMDLIVKIRFKEYGEMMKYLEGRKAIKWEFESWAEKATGEAFIKGVDPIGNIYEGIGIMGAGEIVEVREFDKTDDKDDFNKAVRPLMFYLGKHCHPHMKALVESNCAELVEGVKSVVTDEYIVD